MTMAGVLCAVGLGGARLCAAVFPSSICFTRSPVWATRFVYCCSTALGLKWFPDKRGSLPGLIAAGYGSGAAFFNPVFGYLIRADGLPGHIPIYGHGAGDRGPDRRTVPEVPAAWDSSSASAQL